MKVIIIDAGGESMTFQDLEKYEKDSVYEHWLGLIKEFYKCDENKLKFLQWKEKRLWKIAL